jgi:hypothetical protein
MEIAFDVDIALLLEMDFYFGVLFTFFINLNFLFWVFVSLDFLKLFIVSINNSFTSLWIFLLRYKDCPLQYLS